MFIARVSRGRTVREFLIAVLIIPTLISVLWMTALGGTAINQVVNLGLDGVAAAGGICSSSRCWPTCRCR